MIFQAWCDCNSINAYLAWFQGVRTVSVGGRPLCRQGSSQGSISQISNCEENETHNNSNAHLFSLFELELSKYTE